MKARLLALVAPILAACGGGGGDDEPATVTPTREKPFFSTAVEERISRDQIAACSTHGGVGSTDRGMTLQGDAIVAYTFCVDGHSPHQAYTLTGVRL